MTFFPLLARELNARAMANATYWVRCGIGLIGILICMEAIVLGPLVAPAVAGKLIFNGLVGSAFLLSCGGCLLTADTLSGELREGTLVLLLLTRVKTVDILLSKLGSIGIAGLWSLLALLPVLAIPILVGGVTGGDSFRKALALIDTLFFALCAGLWASAGQDERARSTRKAVLTVILVVLIPLIPFSIMPRVFHSMGLFSPIVLVLLAGDIRYVGSKALYWISLALVQGLSWLFLVCAGLSLKRVVTAAEASAFRHSSAVKKQERALGLASWQPDKADSHPLEWAIYRRNGVSAGLWGIAVVGLAFSSGLNLTRQAIGMSGAASFWLLAPSMGVITGLAGAVLVTWVASRFCVAARQNGTLELLLTTPLGAESLVEQQSKLLRRMFALPILLMQAAAIPLLVQGLVGTHTGVGWQYGLTLSTLLSLANTYFGIETLCWLGLWFGAKAHTQASAIMWAVGLGKGLPSLVSLVCSLAGAVLVQPAKLPAPVFSWILWGSPQVINLLFYLCLTQLIKTSLPAELVGAENKPFASYLKKMAGYNFTR